MKTFSFPNKTKKPFFKDPSNVKVWDRKHLKQDSDSVVLKSLFKSKKFSVFYLLRLRIKEKLWYETHCEFILTIKLLVIEFLEYVLSLTLL